jgi:hypothetical protein
MRFGPAERDDSALWLVKEKRDYIYPLVIDLPNGLEELSTSVTLVAGDNSSGELIINGNNRIMKVKAGAVLTVGGGVTLTLRNITFEGVSNNTTPLLKVGAGGKLILEDGVKLINNKTTTADAGGVWVNNGALILNDGVEITGMEARRGGGVLVDAFGNFIMNGGIIGRKDYGNTASEENGGGGVLVASGSFDMNGGTIQWNSAAAGSSGGGVCVLQKGTFNMNLGTIKKNTAHEVDSGGGVCIISDYNDMVNFVMNGAEVLIDGNTAKKARSGGGVYCYGENSNGNFYINRGTITNNEAQAEHSGGGVFVKNGKLNGGIIQGNDAAAGSSGGGVYISDGSFYISDGSITGNIAHETDSGGGVYIAAMGGLTFYAGKITSNIAEEASSGGGIYTSGGVSFIGGEIKENIAQGADSGGGVYIIGGQFWDPPASGTIVIEENIASGADSGGGAYVAGGIFNPRGTIRGNTTPGISGYDYGVYVKSSSGEAFTMEFDAKVADDNIVFLSSGAVIYISGLRVSPGEIIATIIHESPISGTTPLLRAHNSRKDDFDKFQYIPHIPPIYVTPVQGTGGDTLYWYGIYTE